MNTSSKKRKQWPIAVVTIGIVMLSMTLSLLVALLFTRTAEIRNNQETIRANLQKTAKVVASNNVVKQNVLHHRQNGQIQKYAESIRKVANVQFIVVLDRQYIRYSHPQTNEVGKRFLSVADARKSINGRPHLSTTAGVMGPEYRYFYPIYSHHKVIGLVCLGYSQRNLQAETARLTWPLIIGALFGLAIGTVGALVLERYLRRVLLGMEPDEIATEVVKHQVVINGIVEGIVAIDAADRIIEINTSAVDIFQNQLARDAKISPELKQKFFDTTHFDTGLEHEVWYGSRQLVISTMPLNLNDNTHGLVTVIRDVSEISSLVSQLSGNERYIESLRAQTHQFMNQLHIINGLLEIDDVEATKEFIAKITEVHNLEVGQITNLIKLPSLAGLILGKTRQAEEQQITLTLDPASNVPSQKYSTKFEVDLLRIISNLIDNAIDAVSQQTVKDINLFIMIDKTSNETRIQIEDTGIGISDRDAIFRVGYSTKGDNRGFGMEIIENSVQDLNGSIEIDSTPGRGTVIDVKLKGAD